MSLPGSSPPRHGHRFVDRSLYTSSPTVGLVADQRLYVSGSSDDSSRRQAEVFVKVQPAWAPAGPKGSGAVGPGGPHLKGIGLRVDLETEDGERQFVVKSLSQKGSAARDGTIRVGDILLSVDGAP
ncbi:hypothetical protein T484DRAFT_1759600, partial [Baffinella frigidus]